VSTASTKVDVEDGALFDNFIGKIMIKGACDLPPQT